MRLTQWTWLIRFPLFLCCLTGASEAVGARGDSAAPYVNLRDAESVRHGSALKAVRSNESVVFQALYSLEHYQPGKINLLDPTCN